MSARETSRRLSTDTHGLGLALTLLDATFSICRASPQTRWEPPSDVEFISVTRSRSELSVICDERAAPAWPQVSGGWRCLQVVEPHDIQTPGVLLAIVRPISEAGISVFAVATFDTDHVLVHHNDLSAVIDLLTAAGHHCRS